MSLYDRVMSEGLDADWKPDYERDTVHPSHFVGVIRSNRDTKEKLEPWEHRSHETLPALPKDHVRVIHRTGSDDAVKKIRDHGLHFGHHGMLASTATAYSKPSSADYAPPDDHRFKHAHAVVMDVPLDRFQKLSRVRPAPAMPPRKRVTAPTPETRPEQRPEARPAAANDDIW